MANITIVGGGSSAHTLIPLLSDGGHNVSILTSKPEKWSHFVSVEYRNEEDVLIKTLKGKLNVISSNPIDVIPSADIIILCMPVHKYRIALNNVGKFIDKNRKTYVGTVYGQAGFNWMVSEMNTNYKLENTVTFALGLIPWICRIIEYGKVGVTYGCKENNVAAVSPNSEFDYLNEILFDSLCFNWFGTGKIYQAENFISLTLSVDNQIIHTTRCYGLYLKNKEGWKNINEVPFFYKNYDDLSAEILLKLDEDYSRVRNEIKKIFPSKSFKYMLNYLDLERFSYNSDNNSIKESFVNSKTLAAIKTPVIKEDGRYILDKTHRFFFDDIYYGLCILKSLSKQLNINVPMVDEIIEWVEDFLDTRIVIDDIKKDEIYKYGIPEIYGMKTIFEIVD